MVNYCILKTLWGVVVCYYEGDINQEIVPTTFNVKLRIMFQIYQFNFEIFME